MAEAQGRITGRPGICITCDGVAAAAGAREAARSASPMLALSFEPSSAPGGRDANGESGLTAACRGFAKWASPIPSAGLVPEYLDRAFRLSQSGNPGPVALSLPLELLSEETTAPKPRPAKPAAAGISDAALEGMRHMLSRARRPLLLLGGNWTAAASEGIAEFARANGLPVVTTLANPDCIDNRLENHAGHVGMEMAPSCARLFAECDFLLAVGAALDEASTCGLELIEPPWPHCKLVHVHPGMDELGGAYSADLAINARVSDFAARARRMAPVDHAARERWIPAATDSAAARAAPPDCDGLSVAGIFSWLSGALPDDAVVACDDRTRAETVCRHFRFKRPGTALIPSSSTPGYGFAAAAAAALAFPGRVAVALASPLSLHAASEISAVRRAGGKLIVLAESAPEGAGPDLSALAAAHGARWRSACDLADFREIFSGALGSGDAVSLIEVALSESRGFA